MPYCAEPAETVSQVTPRRRRCPRQTLRTLAYVNLDQGNGGIIRDLTDSGIAVHAVAALRPGQEVSLRFDLLSPRVRGDWLLVQMFASAAASGRDSIFSAAREDELTFSPILQAPILVDSEPTQFAGALPMTRVAWAWFRFSERTFSILVDGLVLLCAVLLFSISSIVVMGGVPAWPLSVALLLTIATIFVALYQIVFSDFLFGATPGARLARLAAFGPAQQEQDQRFR